MPNVDDEWYYAAESEQKGPFSLDQMDALLGAGTIDAKTPVWSRELAGWQPLGQTALAACLGLEPRPPTLNSARPPLVSARSSYSGTSATGTSDTESRATDAGVRTFGEAVNACFAKFATFDGRANRPEFWYFYLFNWIIAFAAMMADLTVLPSAALPLTTLSGLALLLPGLAVSVRRLHDTDRTGWWLLVGLVPILGTIALIILWAQRGAPGPNRFD